MLYWSSSAEEENSVLSECIGEGEVAGGEGKGVGGASDVSAAAAPTESRMEM